jgi:tetratricopeptide (TPR) repeat protein
MVFATDPIYNQSITYPFIPIFSMLDDNVITVQCRECHTSVRFKCPQVDLIHFPSDDRKIVQLLSGQLYLHQCSACSTTTSVFVPLLVLHEDRMRVLAAVPESIADETNRVMVETLAKLGVDMRVTVCRNYNELYIALAPWANEILMPLIETVLGEAMHGDQKVDPDQITPIILRLSYAQLKGTIKPFIGIEQSGKRIDGLALMRDNANDLRQAWLTDLVSEVLTDLRRKAVRTKALPLLEEAIRSRIPVECVIKEVLEKSLSACPTEFIDPLKEPAEISKTFLYEYCNAVLHAYCGEENPHAKHWATCLRSVWLLGKRSDTSLDPQFRLPVDVIRRTARFSDLWDLCGQPLKDDDLDAFKAYFDDRHEMLKAYGFEEEELSALQSGTMGFRISGGDPQKVSTATHEFGQLLLEKITANFSMNASEEQSEEYGKIVGSQLRMLAKSDQIDVGMEVARQALERAIEAGDSVAALMAASCSIEALNLFGEHLKAAEFVQKILNTLDEILPRVFHAVGRDSLMLRFFNEAGNVLRYLQAFDQSLDYYRICESFIDKLPDEKDRSQKWAILRRNQAIVYRELGRYAKALKLFDEQLTETPNDVNVLNSAAVLAQNTGDYQGARAYLDRAIEVTAHRVLDEDRAELFLARGVVRLALDDATGGVKDIAEAFANSLAKSKYHIATRCACAVVQYSLRSESHAEFVQVCLEWLEVRLNEGACRNDLISMGLIVTTLAEHYLVNGCANDAESRLHQEFALLDRHAARMPWQYHIVRSRINHDLERFQVASDHLSAALKSVNKHVPTGEDAAFALGWMYDKRYFQATVGQLAIDLSNRGVFAGDQLLEVYEFLNGREIGARLERESNLGSVAERLAKRLGKAERKVVIFWFMEAGDQVRIGYLSNDDPSPKLLQECNFSQSEIEAVKQGLLMTVNALEPQTLTHQTDGQRNWNDLARTLGSAIIPLLISGCEVYFLLGRTFTGLPLHLVTFPNGRALIEDHPVLYASNFSVLLAECPLGGNTEELIALVSVTKKDDSDEFKQLVGKRAQEFIEMLGGPDRVLYLSEGAADHASVLDAFPRVSEIIFLCHGTNAGPSKGFGICIADRDELPPSLFPIEDVPELSRFVICWDDLEEIKVAPTVLISIACSSGLTIIGQSGTRHGLEQTLFAKGTRLIVSPLWDVDQEAALNWLKAFIEIRKSEAAGSLIESHRLACLRMRERNPEMHPTSWGAFIVNGSIST